MADEVKKHQYPHQQIEAKWQKEWSAKGIYTIDVQRATKPFYNLMMFPYPSAEGLHVGNMYAFTGTDIFGRFKRMQGYDVFEPIGLDGFGIHSENYALKVGRHPIEQAKRSQENFYRQLHMIGSMYDWTRTVETYDPSYYKWTQWLFVQMFRHGLAYRATAEVNWCPSCKTVLADEQVIEGKCERCGNIVSKKALEQWFFKITAYAGKLLENISSLKWSEKVLIAQRNWIGKKEGINITYQVVDEKNTTVGEVTCFTTRPDTNYGATFVVLAPEHPFISQIQSALKKNRADAIGRYIEKVKTTSHDDRIAQGRKKTGVDTGLYCVNPLTGYRMPLYIADFVLMDFGTGAVVGVPAHDERDYAFAKEFGLPIRKVVDWNSELHVLVAKQFVIDTFVSKITSTGSFFEERTDGYAVVAGADRSEEVMKILQSSFIDSKAFAQVDGIHKGLVTKDRIITQKDACATFISEHHNNLKSIWPIDPDAYPFCFTGDGVLVNSGNLDGKTSTEAIGAMMDYLEKKGWGKRETTYHLRDWLISRQRYWGPPIPMIRCKTCETNGKGERADMPGWYTVPEKQLPVELPNIPDYKPGDDGVAPLAKHKEFYETTCPGCGGKAVRETDVSDTFLDSSWYFLRYPSTRAATKDTLPFDPKITKKWLPVSLYTGGAEHSVLHLMYSRFVTMALKDWGYIDFEEPFPEFYAHGLVIKDGAKMSKSKGNVVNPDEYIKLYGTDALRMYLMFMGPFSDGGDFRDAAMEGMFRWVGRVWRMATISLEAGTPIAVSDKCIKTLHRLVKKVGEDTEKRHYNTAIAAMMEFTNLVTDEGGTLPIDLLQTFLLVLAPFAPHVTEELWSRCNTSKVHDPESKSGQTNWSIHQQHWPSYDKKYLTEDAVMMVVQVNGKLRDSVQIDVESASIQEKVEAISKSSEKVQKYLDGVNVRKIIFVPGRIINFVVG